MPDTINLYKLWNPEVRHNPHPMYAQMRAEMPIARLTGPTSGGTFWFLTRYDDCAAALRDPRFGKDFRNHLPPDQLERYPYEPTLLDSLDRHLLNLDPPDHTRLRALVHKAFTPRMIENLRPRIQEIAASLLGDLGGAGEADLIEHFAFPLPVIVIAELLGIPAADRNMFRRWSRILLFGASPEATMQAGIETIGYFNTVFDERRARPQDDLISGLLAVEQDGDQLDQQELLSMIFLLLVAGHETTVNLIASGMLALLTHPDQKRLLLNSPELLRPAVEEMLRFEGPVENALTRWAYEPVTLRGQTIETGDMVMVSLYGANRDPEVFDNPDVFDITREPNKHIAFGGGIHYCLGAPLARLEGTLAIQALLDRFPAIDLAVDPAALVWNNSILLRGLTALPVRLR